MKKVYYEYDSSTRLFKRVYPTFRQRLGTYVIRILEFMLVGAAFFALYRIVLPAPSLDSMVDENIRLQSQYQVLSRKVDDALDVLRSVEERDDNLYRVLLEADPVSSYIRHPGYNAANRYSELMGMSNSDLVISISQRVDLLEKKLYIQSRSFDDVVGMYRENEKRIACIPAIQPVSNKDLKRTASGYGYRIDPVYHVRKLHSGMDFACPSGTPVYATGNGKVVYAKWKTGYGNCVDIDHGYGYLTRYAHLKKIDVKVNQTVTRGEVIGQVGSTGKSTGPHLHYEVLVNNRNVNPVNFYFMDLNAEKYDEMVQMSENQGRVYD
mgnify:CR=1 FL=1